MALEVEGKRCAGGSNQWPNEIPRPDREHSEPGDPGATQQPQEHRLCAIVRVVCGGNTDGTYMRGLAAQRGVTRFSRARLQITAGGELEVRDAERYLVGSRESRGRR